MGFPSWTIFSHYSITPPERLSYVSCYMVGDALGWYQWMHQNKLLSTWDEFTHALELHIGPSTFESYQQALFKLHQTNIMADYQWDFERLFNRIIRLPNQAIIDYFISGLRADIQHELADLHPTSISQAIGLAKLVETKIQATRPLQYFSSWPAVPKITPNFPHP